MNVIFRGNAKRKAERAGRGCTCRGGLQLSSHPLCKERDTDTEKKRGREAEGAKRGCSSCKVSGRECTVQVRYAREKRREKSDGKPECNVFFSKKAPCYVSRLHSHELHKTARRQKKQKEKISSARLVFEIICK